MLRVKKALVSVFDKTGVVEFSKGLHSLGVSVVSTGGTAELLRKSGVPATEVSDLTKYPEMLDGRVKTLHPVLHAGLLAVRDNPDHMKTLREKGIEPIDMVVVNLYPFREALEKKSDERSTIEMIDIGGPSMLRSASKNFKHVAAVSDPSDYAAVIEELRSRGGLSETTLRRLAAKVFRLTSRYDAMIAGYLGGETASAELPAHLSLEFEKAADLRYGENPHQKGALYRESASSAKGLSAARQLHGKELSFNNILDLDAALAMVESFSEPACCVIKHVSPCGFAVGADAASAFQRAHACDPLSAFGGIVGLNVPVDEKAAKAILGAGFLECVIAAGFSQGALSLLKAKKNLRLLSLAFKKSSPGLDYKRVKGGLLVQDTDTLDAPVDTWKIVTKKRPSAADLKEMAFAFGVCQHVKSNAIVLSKGRATVGLGMGQPSRVDSCLTAFRKAGRRARGSVLASDGFFPKPDSIALAKRHGVKAIVQPGGSIQDEEVIRACDKAGLAMALTGVRHFKH